jgi:glutathione S-transferase
VAELPPIIHRPIVRAFGFPSHKVPALLADGERVQTSTSIIRYADRVRPERPFVPTDPGERRAVEEVLAWGERELQPILRWIQPWALMHRPEAIPTLVERYSLPVPPALGGRMALPAVKIAAARNPSNDRTVQVALGRLPALLDRVDSFIADGVIGGEVPNAGDIQVASTLRVLMLYEDLEPAIAPRPGGELARRLLPDVPGRVPSVFPAEALAGLSGGAGH